jgi:hypothetical protein
MNEMLLLIVARHQLRLTKVLWYFECNMQYVILNAICKLLSDLRLTHETHFRTILYLRIKFHRK